LGVNFNLRKRREKPVLGNLSREESFILAVGGLVLLLIFLSQDRKGFGRVNSISKEKEDREEKTEKTYNVLYTRTLGKEEEVPEKQVVAEKPYQVLFNRSLGVVEKEEEPYQVLYSRSLGTEGTEE